MDAFPPARVATWSHAISDTLQHSIDNARASADVLDDPEDLDNQAVMRWLNHHVSFRHGHHKFVLGTGILPLGWQARTVPFRTLQQAVELLRPLKSDRVAMAGMRRAVDHLGRTPRTTDDGVINALAETLSSGRAWLIQDAKSPCTTDKADPSVFAKLNAANGTSVQFAALARWEGNQCLRGYVPFAKGVTAGRSGMTVATGFDIGQLSVKGLDDLHPSDGLKKKLLPFVGLTFAHKTRAQVVAAIAKMMDPVPILDKSEADEADLAVHGKHMHAAVVSWNTRHGKNVPDFNDLPSNWQTVIFSRTFHQGTGMPDTTQAKAFYKAAAAGHWAEAADHLEHYPVSQDWYKARVRQEAAMLRTKLPLPVPAPANTHAPKPGHVQPAPHASSPPLRLP